MLLFSRIRNARRSNNPGDSTVPGAPPVGVHEDDRSGNNTASTRARLPSAVLRSFSSLSIRRKRRRTERQSALAGVVKAAIPTSPFRDDIGDPMESFSPVTDSALEGEVMHDDVPNIIGDKIQKHHELWYRLAYGRPRDRRVSGGYALHPAMLGGKPLPRPGNTNGVGLTHVASWRSRPKPLTGDCCSPQGQVRVTSIDYGNADEVVLNNTLDLDRDILCAEDTLPEGAPRFMLHPYNKRKVRLYLVV